MSTVNTTTQINRTNSLQSLSSRNPRGLWILAFVATALFGVGCSKDSSVMGPTPEPAASIHSIEILESSLSLNPGDTAQLNANLDADDGVANRGLTWSSSSSAIAKVSATGMVTALAPGSAQIKVQAAADPKFNDAITVTVISPGATVSGVSIDPPGELLYFGNSLALTAQVTGSGSFDRTVTWQSNRPHIVSIDSEGRVLAEAVGTAEITATSAGDPSKAAHLTIEVLPARIDGMALSASENEMHAGSDMMLTLDVTALGQIDTSVRWETSNASIASVDGGNVTGYTTGLVTITAISNADASQSASIDLTVVPAFPPMEGYPVNGWEANFVEYASVDGKIIGKFSQGHGLNWTEENNQGTHQFVETSRDEWSIYLDDASREIQVQLDLYVKSVKVIGYTEYVVTNAGTLAVTPLDGFPVDGWNASFVEYSSADRQVYGTFTQEGTKWVEENNQGSHEFVETSRDEWSIYLNDTTRGIQVQTGPLREVGEGHRLHRVHRDRRQVGATRS